MIEWLAKDWFLKLFDVSLGLVAIIGLFLVIFIFIKALRNQGLGNIKVDKKGEISFSFTNDDGVKQTYTSQEIADIVKKKDDEIFLLRTQVNKLQDKLAFLEAEIQKQKVLEEYKNENKIPLNEHAVFFNLRKTMETTIEFGIKNPDDSMLKKLAIAQDFICSCKVPIFYNNLKNFVNDFHEGINEQEAISKLYTIPNKIFDWVEQYNEEAKDLKINFKDGTYIVGVPQSFLDEFNSWHNPHVEIVFSKIKDILFNAFYKSWQLKLILILDAIDTAFYLTITDAEQTIKFLNGKTEKEIADTLRGKK